MSYKLTEGVSNEFLSSTLDLNSEDYEYIRDVIAEAKEVLSTVLTFSDTGILKFLPVRIYVRVISACIFLLKVDISSVQKYHTESLTQLTSSRLSLSASGWTNLTHLWT
jgi:5-bromo-4-chloroindolyl phosphate hydrolysis protein